ncbi:MAG: deoxyribodipyrimidine photo-lyase, partial [Planctomycetota bacterium]|nr:deoxyribodipyrimidine photo-lyase [Planctomycetota bacterium]
MMTGRGGSHAEVGMSTYRLRREDSCIRLRRLREADDMAEASTTVVWFRRDLRTRDNAPLLEAVARGRVVCV